MSGKSFTYRSSQINYLQLGEGSRCLLAFHGFNESGKSILPITPSLGRKYTIYAFDIPYHGDTKWVEEDHFTPSDLEQMIRQFLAEKMIGRFSVLGFSMGAKCALQLVNILADQIDDLWLFAADGIRTNKIYNVAVYPKWGRDLFKTTIHHPGWFFLCVRILHALRILSPWLYKFTINHMDTGEKRQRLYDTWVSMAEFNPPIELIQSKINQFRIHTYLIFGERDEVIRPNVGMSFAAGLQASKLKIIDRGHYFIDERLNEVISELLDEAWE